MNIKALKKTAHAEEREHVDIYRMTVGECNFKIAVTRIKANKRTVIKCSDGGVTFVKYTPIAGGFTQPAETVEANISVSELLEKDTVCMLIISGKPLDIHGLDNGHIASARTYGSDADTKKLYVMSEMAFGELDLS